MYIISTNSIKPSSEVMIPYPLARPFVATPILGLYPSLHSSRQTRHVMNIEDENGKAYPEAPGAVVVWNLVP